MKPKVIIRKLVTSIFSFFGFQIKRKSKIDQFCEGFNMYLDESKKAKMDVNDWIEQKLQWEPALPVLQKVVFKYLETNSCVCEIGPGTGRHARHLLTQLEKGGLHLFDHSTWIVQFLTNYFSKNKNVYVHQSNGTEIDLPAESVDVCFSTGTFIELKLGTIMLYAKEIYRILKNNGYVIFDYLDISIEEGWRFLYKMSDKYHNAFTYYYEETIDRLFKEVGFTLIERYQEGKSTYVVFKKQS